MKNPLDDQFSQLPIKQQPVEEDVKLNTGPVMVEPMEVSVKPDLNSTIQEVSAEGKLSGLANLAPKLLSTIASQFQREVIPVSHEDDSSAWDMDSNPTPELSRTPTPEPIVSFTPVTSSASAESVNSNPAAPAVVQEEAPIPGKAEATRVKVEATEIKEEPKSPTNATNEGCSVPHDSPTKQKPGSTDLSPPLLEPVLPGLELTSSTCDAVIKSEPNVKDES